MFSCEKKLHTSQVKFITIKMYAWKDMRVKNMHATQNKTS